MALLSRPDGVELHWDQRGEGPLVVLCPYWSGHPAAMSEEELRDRVAFQASYCPQEAAAGRTRREITAPLRVAR